jgi:hypothetical protein
MKKLARKELKAIAGGSNKFEWYCYGPGGSGWQYICSDADPSTICTIGAVGGCYQVNCTMTGTKCSTATICFC